MEFVALLDTGAVPNLIYMRILREVCIDAKPTKRTITIASNENTRCVGAVKLVPVFFDGVVTKMDFFAMGVLPVDILVGMLDLERLQARIDLGGQFVEFEIDKNKGRITLKTETYD